MAREKVTDAGQEKVLAVLQEAVQKARIEINPKYGSSARRAARRAWSRPRAAPRAAGGVGLEPAPDAGVPGTGAVEPVAPMGRVVVVGLGPAGPDQLTVAAVRAIDRVPTGRRFLRTARHPAAVAVGEGAASFDRMYDRAATVDEVYAGDRRGPGGGGRRRGADARCCTPCRGRRWWPSARSSCCWPTPG